MKAKKFGEILYEVADAYAALLVENKELIEKNAELKSEIKSIYKAISRAEELDKNIKWE